MQHSNSKSDLTDGEDITPIIRVDQVIDRAQHMAIQRFNWTRIHGESIEVVEDF